MKYFGIIISLFLSSAVAFAQQEQQSEEQQIQESIDILIEQYEDLLDLEYWQVFYVDSILNHNYNAMSVELKALNEAKVNNRDAYYIVQDKWMEEIYNAFGKVFNEEQWTKYLKSGARKEKKSRDKRAEKLKK